MGKSFAVTDDGFLKRIRAAQFSNDMTRVVLDVNDVTEYSAFLLPNPYRLIIDIHGKQPVSQQQVAANQTRLQGCSSGMHPSLSLRRRTASESKASSTAAGSEYGGDTEQCRHVELRSRR